MNEFNRLILAFSWIGAIVVIYPILYLFLRMSVLFIFALLINDWNKMWRRRFWPLEVINFIFWFPIRTIFEILCGEWISGTIVESDMWVYKAPFKIYRKK